MPQDDLHSEELNGTEHEKICQMLGKAFNVEDLRQLVRHRLGKSLEDYVSLNVGEREVIFELVEAAESEGWTKGLLGAAVSARPENEAVLNVCRDLLGEQSITKIKSRKFEVVSKVSVANFLDFLSDFKSVTTVFIYFSVAAPFASEYFQLSPPGVSPYLYSFLIAAIQFVLLLLGFESIYWRRMTSVKLKRLLVVAAISFVGLAAFYCWQYDKRTAWLDNTNSVRVVIGIDQDYKDEPILKANIQYIRQAGGQVTPMKLLELAHDPLKIWTKRSIEAGRRRLKFGWVLMWSAVAFCIVLFVIIQWRRRLGLIDDSVN